MKTALVKFKVGDRVIHSEHGRRVWTVELIEGKDVYWIGRKNEFISMVHGKFLRMTK